MARPFPLKPRHPERICWGCDRYCGADALACGNGSGRTQHPIETDGEDWFLAWGIEPEPDRPNHARLGPWRVAMMRRVRIRRCALACGSRALSDGNGVGDGSAERGLSRHAQGTG